MLKVCVNVLTLNKPPYTPIAFSNGLIYKLVYARKLVSNNTIITILENKIDLSRLKVTAFENNNKTNKDININFCLNK